MDKIDLAAALKEIEHFLPKTNRFEVFKDGKLIFGIGLGQDSTGDTSLKDFLELSLDALNAPTVPFNKSHFI